MSVEVTDSLLRTQKILTEAQKKAQLPLQTRKKFAERERADEGRNPLALCHICFYSLLLQPFFCAYDREFDDDFVLFSALLLEAPIFLRFHWSVQQTHCAFALAHGSFRVIPELTKTFWDPLNLRTFLCAHLVLIASVVLLFDGSGFFQLTQLGIPLRFEHRSRPDGCQGPLSSSGVAPGRLHIPTKCA